MRINYNISATLANNALSKTETNLSRSMERLSSGLKINHAKDNPAGIAISKRMNAQIKGLSVATQNASDGISIVETADGALGEVHAILQRMNELAVQASNGVQTDTDRKSVDEEIQQLKQEITRIADTTEFNGKTLLNGEFDLRGYSSDDNVKVMYYSDSATPKNYTLNSITTGLDADGNTIVTAASILTDGSDNSFPTDAVVSDITKDVITVTAGNGFEVKLQAKADATNVDLNLTGIGALRLQIGANEGQILEIRIPEISLQNMGLADTNVLTKETAKKTIAEVSDAITYISSVRSRLGAYQNRLENATASLDVTGENMTASYSRIMDVDMATEMTEYTTQQVLAQAGTSILAQANERPQQVLQLLQ